LHLFLFLGQQLQPELETFFECNSLPTNSPRNLGLLERVWTMTSIGPPRGDVLHENKTSTSTRRNRDERCLHASIIVRLTAQKKNVTAPTAQNRAKDGHVPPGSSIFCRVEHRPDENGSQMSRQTCLGVYCVSTQEIRKLPNLANMHTRRCGFESWNKIA
jgi:hypothetical protein